jgi:hypothetical protein
MRPPLIACFSSSLLCWRGAAIRLASTICPDMTQRRIEPLKQRLDDTGLGELLSE